MFFRFGCALMLVVLISLTGVGMEKRNLELRRAVSRQHYHAEILEERYAKLKLLTQQLGAPSRLVEAVESGEYGVRERETPVETDRARMPLLHWRRPQR